MGMLLDLNRIRNPQAKYMAVIIDRNTSIPTYATREFYTTYDYQTSALVQLYEGESKYVKDNFKLDQIIIEGIQPLKAGEAKVKVTIKVDASGIVRVNAVDMTSVGNEKDLVVIYKDRLTDTQILDMREVLK